MDYDISPFRCSQSPLNPGMHHLLQDFLDHPPRSFQGVGATTNADTALSLSRHGGGGGYDGGQKVNKNNNNNNTNRGQSSSSFARSAQQQLMGPAARRAASSFLSPFEEGLGAPAGTGSSPLSQVDNDPRRQRIMKNRESAARSRARRQAYTYELERERAMLIEENARLRQKLREQDHHHQVQSATSATVPAPAAPPPRQAPEERRLSRAISASF